LGAGCDCPVPQDVALNSYDEIIISFVESGFAEASQLRLYDKDGNFASHYAGFIFEFFTQDSTFYLGDISIQADNSVLVAGRKSTDSFTNNTGFIAKFTSGTDYSNFVAGNVFSDDNDDCNYDDIELGLEDWLIKIQGDYTTYARSRADGSYNLGLLDTGIFTVNLINPNYLWEDVCIEDTTLNVNADNPNYTVDFAVRPATVCPLLEVDIATPIVRRCFDTYYIVRYHNSGTILAENAYVEVQLDPYFTFLDASIPSTNMGNNLYQFDIGEIEVGETEGFKIDVNVDCNSTVLGQTHCMEAHIYPDSICASVLPTWDGSSVEVDAKCLGDSIEFKIKNIGLGDMSNSLEYVIIEDDLIWKQDNFQLDSGDSLQLYKSANGLYHRLEAEQSPGHPGSSMPSIFIEGCGENDDGEINSTDLEYLIRFQNTGTDTAFNIVIRDTISPHLNIETLRPGVASHDYRYDIDSSNIAVFTFENIMLPDSNINEAASHGFIKFNIEQQSDNPIGTHIMNDAAIYFDFNEPIITNTVFHTIGEDFMGVVTSVITPPEVAEAGISVNVFPNPFDEYTRFEVQGETAKELQLNVYDMVGREVLQQHATHQQHITMKRNNLPPGVYVFRLRQIGHSITTSKKQQEADRHFKKCLSACPKLFARKWY